MRKNLDIYLLIGQSNMAGRGNLEEVSEIIDDRILIYRDDKWQAAKEPLHQDNPELAGIGLAMSFALESLKHKPNTSIGLIPCAKGWTSIKEWKHKSPLYNKTIKVTKMAMKAGTVKGILWHQGESDTLNLDDAKNYGNRLKKLILNLRNDIKMGNTPFISGELADFLKIIPEFLFVDIINNQIQNLKRSVKNYDCVSVNGLESKSDHLHFNSKSLRQLGVRYAEVNIKYQSMENYE